MEKEKDFYHMKQMKAIMKLRRKAVKKVQMKKENYL
jgi:hypothetical protein